MSLEPDSSSQSYDTPRPGELTSGPGGRLSSSRILDDLFRWANSRQGQRAFARMLGRHRRVRRSRMIFDSPKLRDPTAHLSRFHVGGAPPPDDPGSSGPTVSDAPNSEIEILSAVLSEDGVPYRARRCREAYRADVEEYVGERTKYGILAKRTTSPHRRLDLLRWPTMCRRAEMDEQFIAGAADVTAEQVLAVKECGIWRTNTLKPILSGLRGFCRHRGNPELAARDEVWFLPRGTDDRRVWLSESQLALVIALSTGRVRVRVWLQGCVGMREDSARALLRKELLLDGPNPRLLLGVKGPDGERLPVSVDSELAAGLRSWVESQSMGPDDRVYPVCHSTADGDLRRLGEQAGLPFPLSGHVLRRSWARIAYLGKPTYENQRKIGKVLGHKDPGQTWWYIGGDYLDMGDALASFRSRMQGVVPGPT